MARKEVVIMNYLTKSNQKGVISVTEPELLATLGVIALALIPGACYGLIELIKIWRKR